MHSYRLKGKALIVIAHPDDEALYFYSIIRGHLRKYFSEVLVCCVTGVFGNERDTIVRLKEFERYCDSSSVSCCTLAFEDTPNKHLPLYLLINELRLLSQKFKAQKVFTHGPFGEYGNIHHSDISLACSMVFKQVYYISGPLKPDIYISLSTQDYRDKLFNFISIYSSQSYLYKWATDKECFVQLNSGDVLYLCNILETDYLSMFGIKAPTLPSKRLVEMLTSYTDEVLPCLKRLPSKIRNRQNQRIAEVRKRID